MRIYLAGLMCAKNIPLQWKQKLLQGGFFEENENIPCKPAYNNNIQRGGEAFETLIAGGGFPDQALHPYILESFYYVDEDTEKLLPHFGDFMLDSGAFTFMQGKEGETDWVAYIERYADFISRNNVEKFFELDIDSVAGYEKVLEYRKLLERLTQKQCIPVWHSNRGFKEFERMAEEYGYVAIGGLVNGSTKAEYARKYWSLFPKFIKTAHAHKAKIHALGFTNLEGLRTYHFDSVDSTSWTSGNRFGHLWKFNGTTMVKQDAPSRHRIIKPREAALNNFIEWVKFQGYAETHL